MRIMFFVMATAVLAVTVAALRSAAAGDKTAQKAEAAEKSAKPVKIWSEDQKGYVVVPRVVKTDEEWSRQLTKLQYEVTRKAGTERAGTGALLHNHDRGVYRCVACDTDLF